jgi:glycosyltransferase involved in cell wall biosynthesis
MGSPFERFLREVYYSIKYRRIHAKLKQVTAGVLALGQLGVDTYKKYGWDNNLLYPFMYCPPLKPLDKKDLQFKTTGHIKFLYVGRFYYKTKGTDVLLDAAEKLNGDFTVDFVGGYGKNKDEVISRIEKSANMHYLGTWPSNEVGAKMQDYDAIVIPTKYDGWNLLVNEAVNAGTPIIVTDGAVSDEVVSRYKCGIVIPHSNVKSLRLAMQTVVDNPNSLLEYQDNSKVAKSKINESVVGSYLIDIIKHCIYKSETRPVCPWHH